MSATRRTQPYRRGARQPGAALRAMRKGRTLFGYNPMDAPRQLAKRRGGLRAAMRRRLY